RRQHGRQRFVRALKIRDEHLDAAARHALANGLNGESKKLGAAVLAVVAIDAGHDRISQSKSRGGLRHPARLVIIDFEWLALLDGAEPTAARADVPQDHEGGRPPIPALTDVRAGGALADRVQAQPAHQILQLAIILTYRRRGLEPRRPG